jgi:cytoskeletal protein CcmA (bactofilin family)
MHFTTKLIQYQGAPCGAHPGALELNKPKSRPQSLLEPSVKITGDLWSEGDVQIDGHLCGNINCAQLIVSKDAAVTGIIIGEEAVIRGKITGIIRATRVLLQGSARVKSEIIYQSLSIDEGATFEGVARPRLNPLEEEIAVSPWPNCGRLRGRSRLAARMVQAPAA